MKNTFGVTDFRFGSLLDYALAHVPDKIAVYTPEGSITYRQLHQQANRVANAVLRHVKPGEHIGILSINCIEYLEITIGCARADVTVVNINWRLSPQEAANLVLFNDCRLLFIKTENPAWEEALRALLKDRVKLVALSAPDEKPTEYDSMIAGESSSFPSLPVDPDHVLFHIHTSGTTGTPKCIMHSHRSFIHEIISCRDIMGYHQDEVYQCMNQLFHVASIGPYIELSVGGTLVLFCHFDADRYLSSIEEHRVTRLSTIPTVLKALLRQIHRSSYCLDSIQTISYSTSPIPSSVLDDAMAMFPNCGFVQSYGMTEMGSVVTFLDASDHKNPDRLRSVGKCIPGCEIRIVGDDGAVLPFGDRGEIQVKGPSLLKGYYKRPELYEKYVKDGWLCTGDAGYLNPDGYLFLEGRKDDMIISGGENIYPKEIEDRIMELTDDVKEAAVFGISDEKWTEVPCACVVLQPGSTLTADQIRAHLRGHLAHYKIPKRIEIVLALPKNTVGKVLKHELKKLYSPVF